MTIADHIREDTKLNFVRNLLKEGYDASFIAKMTELSVKKFKKSSKKQKNPINNIAMTITNNIREETWHILSYV